MCVYVGEGAGLCVLCVSGQQFAPWAVAILALCHRREFD